MKFIWKAEKGKKSDGMRKAYTTDLTDQEWEIIEPLFPGPKHLGRKIEYSRREILNAIFYLNRNGCAWRDLPGDLPPYGTVSH
jgi:transposase